MTEPFVMKVVYCNTTQFEPTLATAEHLFYKYLTSSGIPVKEMRQNEGYTNFNRWSVPLGNVLFMGTKFAKSKNQPRQILNLSIELETLDKASWVLSVSAGVIVTGKPEAFIEKVINLSGSYSEKLHYTVFRCQVAHCKVEQDLESTLEYAQSRTQAMMLEHINKEKENS